MREGEGSSTMKEWREKREEADEVICCFMTLQIW